MLLLVAVAALAGRPEWATTSIAGALSSHSAPLGKRLFDHILHISPPRALKDAGSRILFMRAQKNVVGNESTKCQKTSDHDAGASPYGASAFDAVMCGIL